MTEISRFWQSTSPGDAGPYSSDQFARYIKLLLHGAFSTSGVIQDSVFNTPFALLVRQTTVASASIEVIAGSAMVDGTFYENDATVTIAIAANVSADPRIDTVVLRKDWATQTVRLAVLQGTPAVTPVAPTLTTTAGVLWEIPIADISVASGFVTLTNSNIRKRSTYANMSPGTIITPVVNNSGGILEEGDVVVWDNTANLSVKTTTQAGDPNIAGVWASGRTNNGSNGRILTRGLALVNVTTTPTLGDRIEASSTAGQARVSPGHGNLGRVVVPTGFGRPVVYVDVQNRSEDYVLIRDEKATGTDGGTFTSGAWRTRVLTTEVVDTGNMAALASNQITLQPGVWRCRWSAPGYQVGLHKTRLYNITDAAVIAVGTAERVNTADSTATRSFGQCKFTLTAAKVLELQHQCGTTGTTTGFGVAVGFSEIEVYATIEFWKES